MRNVVYLKPVVTQIERYKLQVYIIGKKKQYDSSLASNPAPMIRRVTAHPLGVRQTLTVCSLSYKPDGVG